MQKTKTYRSVWDAIESTPAAAAQMKARSELMHAIREAIDDWDITQARAAKRLGISQPRLNDLFRGKLGNFSLDALVKIATNAGLSVRVRIGKAAA
ncbi:MAG TPA: XRE family transcriptional regulator [Rhizomicrobium sp.]|jgi:predicted XRE-type DNA-binding protein|nr:XRE family transcriptional regulator [Rhizomicrobium sp.]